MNLGTIVSSGAFVVGVIAVLFGIGDLELGHQLAKADALGFIERGLEVLGGASLFSVGWRLPGPPSSSTAPLPPVPVTGAADPTSPTGPAPK